jgi:hypothetical protein
MGLFLPALLVSLQAFLNLSYGQAAADGSATGISRAFNPAISVNALFSGMSSNQRIPLWDENSAAQGLHLQAADVEITANVDVFLQSRVVFGGSETESVGVEEAYLTSLSMPVPIIIRGGKMLSSFGRYNLYHIHHMAFAENPLILDNVFGPKLNEVGIEVSYLLPVSWYSELLGGFLNGNNERLFNSPEPGDFAYLAHYDNFWDLSDETTLRMGASYLTGARGLYNLTGQPFDSSVTGITSHVWGLDFQLKWKPLQYNRYHAFVLEGEYVNAALNINNSLTGPLHGYYIQGLYQPGLRWWLQGRVEWLKRSADLNDYFPGSSNVANDANNELSGHRFSAAVAYVPTEFSAYRLQYNLLRFSGMDEHQIVLQVNVTIGSHPAHKY